MWDVIVVIPDHCLSVDFSIWKLFNRLFRRTFLLCLVSTG